MSKTDSNQYLSQGSISVGLQTFSIYAKAGDSDFVYVRFLTGGERVTFDLQNGITLGLSGSIDAKIELVSGTTDWYRCSLTADFNSNVVRIYPAEGNGDTSGTSGSIYIQDAMLNQGMVAYPYVETIGAPVAAGILEDTPRIDFSGGNQSLLLEPSRTNLVPYSEYFSSWQPVGSPIITENTTETLSPEGRYNATKIVGDGNNGIYKATLSTAGGNNVKSIYIKGINGGETCALRDPNQSNVVTTCNITTEWQRFECVDNQTSNMGIWLDNVPASGIYIWGAQLEQDATYPTSYIPTYGVSQTRLGETIDYNIIEPLSNSEGTLLVNLKSELNTLFSFAFLLNNDGATYVRVDNVSNDRLRVLVRLNSVFLFVQTNYEVFTAGQDFKVILKYSENKVDLFVDGEKKIDGVGTWLLPSLNTLTWQGRGTETKQLLVFPTALSDEECITLTTI